MVRERSLWADAVAAKVVAVLSDVLDAVAVRLSPGSLQAFVQDAVDAAVAVVASVEAEAQPWLPRVRSLLQRRLATELPVAASAHASCDAVAGEA